MKTIHYMRGCFFSSAVTAGTCLFSILQGDYFYSVFFGLLTGMFFALYTYFKEDMKEDNIDGE